MVIGYEYESYNIFKEYKNKIQWTQNDGTYFSLYEFN